MMLSGLTWLLSVKLNLLFFWNSLCALDCRRLASSNPPSWAKLLLTQADRQRNSNWSLSLCVALDFLLLSDDVKLNKTFLISKPKALCHFCAEKNVPISAMAGNIWTWHMCVLILLDPCFRSFIPIWKPVEVQDCDGSDHVAKVFGGYKLLPGLYYCT